MNLKDELSKTRERFAELVVARTSVCWDGKVFNELMTGLSRSQDAVIEEFRKELKETMKQ